MVVNKSVSRNDVIDYSAAKGETVRETLHQISHY